VTATQSGTPATPDATPRVAIDFTVFDRECAKRGATSEPARAKLVDTDRTTLWRWRKGRQTPTLDKAEHLAATFEITLDELTGRAA